jgi:hypothetical protein
VGKIGRVRIPVVLFAAALGLASCASPTQTVEGAGHPPVRVGEQFSLAVGDSARIVDTDFVLIFDAVAEDSRCAKTVTCVWEGNARARFTLRQYEVLDARTLEVHDDAIELNTSGRFSQRERVVVGRSPAHLELRSLAPQPPVQDPDGYVATLFIEAGP